MIKQPRRKVMNWKQNNNKTKKNKTPPKKDLKPFQVKHYRFFPCCRVASIKEGFICYLAVRRKSNGYFLRSELESPRFKSEKEAREFATNNKDVSFIPG